MKTKFDSLIEKYTLMLEQDDLPLGDVDDPMGEAPTEPSKPILVSNGYAYLVNVIYTLLNSNTEDIDKERYNLSDNKVTNSEDAYRYIDVLTKLLPQNVETDLSKYSVQPDEQQVSDDQDVVELDDNTLINMANLAIKAYYYTEKGEPEFNRKVSDLQKLISDSGGQINTSNAFGVYNAINDFIGLSDY